jgi:hypothetical protein
MALTSYATYANFTGGNAPMTSGQFSVIAGEVEQAVKDFCRSNLEAATYSNIPLSAPLSRFVVLPEGPVAVDANLSISYNPTAYGNVSAFDANHTLTLYSQFAVQTDSGNASISSSRVIERIGATWANGGTWVRPMWGALTVKPVPQTGAILASWRGGYETIPASITLATNLAISLLWARRTTGQPVTARSIDGMSVSYAGPADAAAVIASPGVASLLSRFENKDKKLGWGIG